MGMGDLNPIPKIKVVHRFLSILQVSTTEFPAETSMQTHLIVWAIQELLDPDNSLGDLPKLRTVINDQLETIVLLTCWAP